MENQTIIGKKMNRGIYAITVIGESLSGEKNLVLILEIIRNCGKNVIGENKKNRTISVQYISMSYSPVSAGGCGFIDGKLGCLCLETKEEFYVSEMHVTAQQTLEKERYGSRLA